MNYTAEHPPIDHRVAELVTSLERVRGTHLDQMRSRFPFSNDREVSTYLPRIQEEIAGIRAPLKVGLVIGSGGLLTVGKEIPTIDMWMMVDKNEQLLESQKQWADYVAQQHHAKDLRNLSFEPQAAELFSVETTSYGPYHYAAGDVQLAQTKAFLRKKNIAYVPGDMTDRRFISTLSGTLATHKAQIVFANLSNIMEWIKGDINDRAREQFAAQLEHLPWHEKSVFLYSQSIDRSRMDILRSDIICGMRSYITAASHLPVNNKG